jgi:tRNA-binding protein
VNDLGHEIDPDGLPYDPPRLERKEYIGFGEFIALDLRTGIVVMAEEFPEMRKPSYKITVDFGPVVGRLQSSAQITNYSRADLVGRMVVGAINLGEKTLPGGFVSQFLVLGALDPDGTVRLLEMPDGVLPGSMVA